MLENSDGWVMGDWNRLSMSWCEGGSLVATFHQGCENWFSNPRLHEGSGWAEGIQSWKKMAFTSILSMKTPRAMWIEDHQQDKSCPRNISFHIFPLHHVNVVLCILEARIDLQNTKVDLKCGNHAETGGISNEFQLVRYGHMDHSFNDFTHPQRKYEERCFSLEAYHWPSTKTLWWFLPNGQPVLSSLQCMRVIGRGGFGVVKMVRFSVPIFFPSCPWKCWCIHLCSWVNVSIMIFLRTSNNFWNRSGKSIWAGFYYQTMCFLGKCHVTSLEFTKMHAIYVLFPIRLLDSKLWKASNFANLEGYSTVITCDFSVDKYYKTSVKMGGSQLLKW